MIEINIDEFKSELEKPESEFYLKEMKKFIDHSGRKKNKFGHTKNKFKFCIIFENDGKTFLFGADEKILIPENSKILKAEANSFIIKKSDGMIFLNSR